MMTIRFCLAAVFMCFVYTGVLLFVCGLSACSDAPRLAQADAWYNTTKGKLFQQSDCKADSTFIQYQADSSLRIEQFYLKQHLFCTRSWLQRRLCAETYYANSGDFTMHREVCTNTGQVSLEAIYYKQQPYGLYTARHCNGQLKEQGLLCGKDTIGVWKSWDPNGNALASHDYGRLELIDQFPVLH